SSFTFDERVIETTYDKKGRPKDVDRRLYYGFSGDKGEEGSRELVLVDDRPATAEEKKDSAEKDAKQAAKRKRRVEDRAKEAAEKPPKPTGDDDDPAIGARRLS